MESQTIQIQLEGIDKNLIQPLNTTNTKLQTIQKNTDMLGNGFTKMSTAVAVWEATFDQVQRAANEARSIANACIQQEVAENRLMAVMKARGIGTKELHEIYTKVMPKRCGKNGI